MPIKISTPKSILRKIHSKWFQARNQIFRIAKILRKFTENLKKKQSINRLKIMPSEIFILNSKLIDLGSRV